MGISHEYHSTSHRARHGGVSGKLRLAVAVLAILVAAPLGAVGIDRLGTKLLPPAPQPGAETEV